MISSFKNMTVLLNVCYAPSPAATTSLNIAEEKIKEFSHFLIK